MKHPFLPVLPLCSIVLLSSLLFTPFMRAQSSAFFNAGPNNAGTEFYLAFPANWEINTANKYIRLYISSDVETDVDIYVLGAFKGSVKTIPNEVVTYDLTNLEGQIFVRSDQSVLPDDQVYTGKAVRIVAEKPIVVYGMNRTDFTSDGFLALPVDALGREYIVASAASVGGTTQVLPSQYMIVAPYDNTRVQITNPMDTPNHNAGETFTVTLNKGDVFSTMSIGFSGDLSGAHLVADRPIAVLAGQNCTYLPTFQYPACDHLVEMMLPVEAWGKVYHSLPFRERTKGDTYRIFASHPETDVFVNGEKIITLTGVGGANGQGWTEYRQQSPEPLVFTGSRPIFVAQYNNSQTYDNSTSTDPFYTVLTPVEQYQTDVVFTVPKDDFAKNFVSLVSDSVGLHRLEIAEAGKDNWKTIVNGFTGSVQTFKGMVDGKMYTGKSFAIAPGTYQLRGEQPFAGYVYGGGQFASYGYPLSVATAHTNVGAVDGGDERSSLSMKLSSNPVTGDQAILVYTLALRSNVLIQLTNMSGEIVYQVTLPAMEAGVHQSQIDVQGISSGTYFCSVIADGKHDTRTLTVLR